MAGGQIYDRSKIRHLFAEALVRPLLQTNVLHLISDLQRSLDVLDIEGLSKLWKEVELVGLTKNETGLVTPLGGNSPHFQISDPSISDWTEFLNIYTSSRREILNYREPSPKDLGYYLLAYLLSATFKDCSIIVRLNFLRSGDNDVGHNSIVVIDLDPKSMNKFRNWEELDKEIVAAYSPAQRKVCIDARREQFLHLDDTRGY